MSSPLSCFRLAAPRPFRHWALAAAFLGLAALPSHGFAAGGTVTANVLEDYQKPLAIVVDPMDDSEDSQAIAASIKRSLGNMGIPAVEDGEVVLEVDVNASADSAGQGRSTRAEAESRRAVTEADQLSTMAPTHELSPNTPDTQSRHPRQGSANIDITLTLHKRGKPPMWRATGSAPRDFRSVADQASDLAAKALTLLGKTETMQVEH